VSEAVREAKLAEALAAAGIPPQRLGRNRTERLPPAERTVYHWILRRFADGARPDREALATESARRGVPLAALLATFAREDLVHIDETGSVVVAYPFSGRPTPHRVRFNGREAFAMCAIDALGIAPMLDIEIEVASSDPIDGNAVRVALTPEGQATWEPPEAVVVAGRTCEGAAYQGCCQVLNFFASRANAERYLRERADVRGFPITIPEAVELGRTIFGEALAAK
jgi:hypothetical protein